MGFDVDVRLVASNIKNEISNIVLVVVNIVDFLSIKILHSSFSHLAEFDHKVIEEK